jgi:hypothetical protein
LRGGVDDKMVRQVALALDEGRRDFTVDISDGGNVFAAEMIAELLNVEGGTVTVTGRCWSACALLGLGIKRKYATTQANVRIHGAIDATRPSDDKAANEAIDYMVKSGLPRNIALGRGKGTTLYKLSPTELAEAGVRPSKPEPNIYSLRNSPLRVGFCMSADMA